MYNNVNVNHPLIQRENNYVSIKKNVSVHSDDRDISKWPNANDFEIELPQPLKQVQYMKLTEIIIPSELCNISSTYQNNKFLFSYASSSASGFVDYIKNTPQITHTDGCGIDATVTTIVIGGGVVTSIDVDGGTGYSAGDKIFISVNDVELGHYIITSIDIHTASTGDFVSGNLTGTMPTNHNIIANATYNNSTALKSKILTIPNGVYRPEELASVLEVIINTALDPNYTSEANTAGKFFVEYNNPEKKFYFGNNETNAFVFHFDERAHEYILSSGGYGTCLQNNDQYYTKTMWGLGATLGFDKSIYAASAVTVDQMFTTSINNHRLLNSDINISTAQYADSSVRKHSKIWLPLGTGSAGNTLSSVNIATVHIPSTIYMEVDKYNNSDELIPNTNNSSSYNISSKLTNTILSKETCNTSGSIDTLSYKRGMDSSNRTNNIKQRNAFSNQASSGTTVKYGGKINSYFAKLSIPDLINSQYINISGDDIKTITLFSNQLEERIQKLKVKFRFHDGTLVDFGNSDINFTIEFGTILSDQEKDMKIRNIYR